MGADDMFKTFTAHTCQGDRPIILRQVRPYCLLCCRLGSRWLQSILMAILLFPEIDYK